MKRLKAPSVTEIISKYINKDFFTDEHRDRGTQVHEVCEALVSSKGRDSIVSCLEKNGHLLYFKSIEAWSALMQPKATMTECRMYGKSPSGTEFCGKPDFIGGIRGQEGTGLIDFKTSVQKQSYWDLQVAAYTYLAEQNGITIDWAGTLRVRRTGAISLYSPTFISRNRRAYKIHLTKFMAMLEREAPHETN